MKIKLLFLLFLWYLFGFCVFAERIYLLDTMNATTELNWETISNLDEQGGWLEESYRTEDDDISHHAYSACNREHTNADNWLLVPRIQRGEANRLYIEVKFSMKSCSEMPELARTCKETLRLYGRQLNSNERLPRSWNDEKQWSLIDTFTAKSERMDTYIQTSSFEVNSSSVYFAFRDFGSCSSLLYVKVYYEICISSDRSCTQLPSKPSMVKILEKSPRLTTIIWEEPSNLGDLREIFYSFKCSLCGSFVKANPSTPYFKDRRLTLSNLDPGRTYSVMIYAHKNVSNKSSDDMPYVIVEITTPLNDINIGENIAYTGKNNSSWWHSGFTLWAFVILGIIVMAIACSILFVSRRSNSNRKQISDFDMLDNYKQGPISPDDTRPSTPASFSSSLPVMFRRKLNTPIIPSVNSTRKATMMDRRHQYKHYIDPSTYKDPHEALTEFTHELDPSYIQVSRQIGVGEFGEVCCGRLTIYGMYGGAVQQVVAVKTLHPESSTKVKADFLIEASIMGQFQHENVIQLVGVVTKSEPIMIVTEYALNGSLDKFLQSTDNGSISLQQLVEMLRGIASGMKYLNDMSYVHRDLAARNVLVDDMMTCKIADFGLSRGLQGPEANEKVYAMNDGKIPIRWTAPEAIHQHMYTTASDVWSYGIVMWEVCSFGECPYSDWTNQKVITEVDQGFRLPCPKDAPPILHALMLHCWQLDRHKRPTFSEILTRLNAFANELEDVDGKFCSDMGHFYINRHQC